MIRSLQEEATILISDDIVDERSILVVMTNDQAEQRCVLIHVILLF
jgi:hypothetical protein